ncbi:uncharacterized protein LOC121879950 [Homarus americanus]|uniref:Putative adipokinetic hormone corazonin-like 2 n=1 Tax=Homarus americanus TaxID=6706 RepID=A0A8J5JI51_HOMAM|nr:uncharacterized protein LOC121879950 [Homarus americanus]KAG7157576.1 putative adipokinetic hormone corazonin-like 2 [Homarus americanus]
MVGWQVMLAVMCLALAPTLAQITFSRSWVPQGKRSGGITGPLVTPGGGSDLGADPCKDVRLATLTQVASHLADLMDDTFDLPQDDAALALRLKHGLVARRRRMS